MSKIEFASVTKAYSDNNIAVRNLSLSIETGSFLTLLGASGCGKTTCLRMVAGFVSPTSGRISIGNRDITMLPPHVRNTGMVFQSYALFPHKTVYDNIAFGLKERKIARAEVQRRTREAIELIHMENFSDRYPRQLSGGQQQRVALARAIVIRPDVLLLDEPLAALDLKLRERLQTEIRNIQRELNITTLFVTHDQGEALRMSDKIGVMNDGEVIQIDTPANIYKKPNSKFVAQFVGKMNFLKIVINNIHQAGTYVARLVNEDLLLNICSDQTFYVGQRAILGVRPECVVIGNKTENSVNATVNDCDYNGDNWTIKLTLADGENFLANIASDKVIPKVNEIVHINWECSNAILIAD